MLLKSNVVAKHLAISVPLHDLSHYFWSVLLLQAFFFTDNLTLPSRVDRSSPTTTLLLSTFRIMCPATPILSSAVLSTLIWSTYNHQSLDICCTTSTPALAAALGAPHPEELSKRMSQRGHWWASIFFPIRVSVFFRGARRGRVRRGPGCE